MYRKEFFMLRMFNLGIISGISENTDQKYRQMKVVIIREAQTLEAESGIVFMGNRFLSSILGCKLLNID